MRVLSNVFYVIQYLYNKPIYYNNADNYAHFTEL